MDSEISQGNVLICSPSPAILSTICFTETPNVPSESIAAGPSCAVLQDEMKSKSKTKRSRPKSKAKFKKTLNELHNESSLLLHEVHDLVDQPEGVLEEFDKSVKDVIGLMTNMDTLTLGKALKPKKVRTKKKKSGEEGEMGDDTTPSTSQTEEETKQMENREKKEKRDKHSKKEKKVLQTLQNQEKTRKHDEPFFPDNRKTANSKKKTNVKKKKDEEVKFEEYLTTVEVEQGLRDKTMVGGAIRINQRCYKEAYITSEGDEKDIMIEGLHNRNRALEGDEVVVLINPPEAWKVSGQRTGKVVFIQEKAHTRSCIGKLPSTREPNNTYIVFSPRDPRVPRIKIFLTDKSLPQCYLKTPTLYSDTLFHAQITEWNDVKFAEGIIVAEVGKTGDVEVETMAILLENNLDPRPVDPMLNLLFPCLPYTIPDEEIAKRLDLRKECIFTIDPLTARDLDDAVSAKRLNNGNVEVGVHISDVSHFLHSNTLLDRVVSKRATTIYLVQRVYHMLPVELCQLCSLTPMEDKLAFSVFLELTPCAQVVSHRFARSVINSCTKLAYEHAQMVIDNPEKIFTSEDFPEVGNGFSAEDCAVTIQELFKLSVIMRERRFDSGALRIDQPKLCFHLSEENQFPIGCSIYKNKESHRLIEEFMLLANMTVARHIYEAYPKLAFLRQHLPPRINMLTELQKRLKMYGIHLDITDAGTLHSSMLKYNITLPEEDGLLSWARYVILNNLCAKPMLRAEYFCPSDENAELHHYALNASCYTHFTSPIRRYADVMVHRLLAASLDLCPQPTWSSQDTKRIAGVCNRQKLAAKVAGEQSTQLFLALFLQEPVESAGAVIDVKDRSLDVIVKDFGITLRVYTDPLPVKVEYSNIDNMAQMNIYWNDGPVQLVQLFSVVRVQVSCAKNMLKPAAILLPPLQA